MEEQEINTNTNTERVITQPQLKLSKNKVSEVCLHIYTYISSLIHLVQKKKIKHKINVLHILNI